MRSLYIEQDTFEEMSKEEATRYSRSTLCDVTGKERRTCKIHTSIRISQLTSVAFIFKFFSWYLGTGILAFSYNMRSKTTRGLLFGLKSLDLRRQFIDRLKLRKKFSSHPMLLPLVLCELLAERHCEAVDTSTKRIFEMETILGVHDYVGHKPHGAGEPANLDFTTINQSLHGELTRLANYEKWVKSHIVILENVLKGPEFTIREEEEEECEMDGDIRLAKDVEINTKEYGESILNWNIDLQSRIMAQQKIVDGQIQIVCILLELTYGFDLLTFLQGLQPLGSTRQQAQHHDCASNQARQRSYEDYRCCDYGFPSWCIRCCKSPAPLRDF